MSISDIQAIDSVGDPPLPIPNREVKPDSADGTALSCGRVGHRHFFSERVSKDTETLFFCLYIFMRYGSALPLIPLFNKWAAGTALSLWESRLWLTCKVRGAKQKV